jgi:NTP pyrophosphatase (non-canonical NTP hydrolase)
MDSIPQSADLIFTTNELAGETGEACNVAKKIDRTRRGVVGGVDVEAGRAHLAEELADVMICAQNVALMEGIDLEHALVAKFNKTSAKNGLRTAMVYPAADGITLINLERHRQKNQEGWTAEHDDEHTNYQLVRAASAYLSRCWWNDSTHVPGIFPSQWAAQGWWKPSPDPVRNLVKAGALIAAEIDRLQRKGGVL